MNAADCISVRGVSFKGVLPVQTTSVMEPVLTMKTFWRMFDAPDAATLQLKYWTLEYHRALLGLEGNTVTYKKYLIDSHSLQ